VARRNSPIRTDRRDSIALDSCIAEATMQSKKGNAMLCDLDRQLRWGTAALLVLSVLVWAAAPAHARPKGTFTLGLGLASQSVSGSLDGNKVYFADPVIGPFVAAGKLESGTGVNLLGGITLNDNLAVEAIVNTSKHDASHVGLPGVAMTANLASVLAAVRLMLPLGDSFELFGRGTLGVYTVKFDNNTQLPPNPTLIESTFSGTGLGIGGGIALFFDPLGLELGVLTQKAKLDSLSAGGTDGSISGANLNVTTVNLTATVHFGGSP
jgi:hypothetical protein